MRISIEHETFPLSMYQKCTEKENNIYKRKYCFFQFQVQTLLPRWKMANMFISFSVNKQLNTSIVGRYVLFFHMGLKFEKSAI